MKRSQTDGPNSFFDRLPSLLRLALKCGTLLMGALMILPVVAAKNIAWSLKSMTAFAIALGVFEMVAGVWYACQGVRYSPRAAIILIGGAVFVLSLIARCKK